MQEHVGDSVLDGKLSARLRTHQATFQNVDFEYKVVQFSEHVQISQDCLKAQVRHLQPFTFNFQVLSSRTQSTELRLLQNRLNQLYT